MKVFVAIGLCGVANSLSAQTTSRTFTSKDGVFQFKYSRTLIDCMLERTQLNSMTSGVPQVFVGRSTGSSVPDACVSQGRVCDDGGRGASTIACFAYPKDKFKDKPTFVAAAFFVAEVEEATTEKVCLEASPYWNTDGVETTKISGETFRLFHISDAGLGSAQSGRIYRALHNKKCYELGIQMANSNPGNYDPGTIKVFTKQDWDAVNGSLERALNSFSFLK